MEREERPEHQGMRAGELTASTTRSLRGQSLPVGAAPPLGAALTPAPHSDHTSPLLSSSSRTSLLRVPVMCLASLCLTGSRRPPRPHPFSALGGCWPVSHSPLLCALLVFLPPFLPPPKPKRKEEPSVL